MQRLISSFRDPDGFVCTYKDTIYRIVTLSGEKNYEQLMQSGLYKELTDKKLLIQHKELKNIRHDFFLNKIFFENLYKIIQPQQIPFLSYPYEWCFSQLKNAALATLQIQKIALNYGMTLKDCSAYNIQFFNNSPVLIDSLSFEKYIENEPWSAYGQFCRHFLAPLALMKYRDISLNQLLKENLDGISLQLAAKLLPLKSFFSFSIFLNVYLHSKTESRPISKNIKNKKVRKHSLPGIIDSLESGIKSMRIKVIDSEWIDYYNNLEYSDESFNQKKLIVSELLDKIRAKTLWDIGANTGLFSRVASEKGIQVVSIDADAGSVEKNYNECIAQNIKNIIPLCIDINNPSPSIGWNNQERMSLIERGPVDVVLALALIHHLIIGNNLTFELLAGFFNKICKWLIIEYIPKEDSRVKQLLLLRKDIFTDYSENTFKSNFSKYFTIKSRTIVNGTDRVIYLMQRKIC